MQSILLGTPQHAQLNETARRYRRKVACIRERQKEMPMTTKRVLGQLVMIAALAVMTAGVMPAPTAVEYACDVKSPSVPNIHTYGEQSSIGNPFDLAWIWFETVVLQIL
jgi:hypothetical protein